MTFKEGSFRAPVGLAIADGATTPNPGAPGVVAWSTTVGANLTWMGSQWKALSAVDNSTVALRIAKLLRAAETGALGNPRSRPVMPSPPTVTTSTTTTLTNAYLAYSGSTIVANAPFTYAGGIPYISQGSGQLTLYASHVSGASSGNIDGTGPNNTSWRIHAMTDAATVAIGVNSAAQYRLLVDDQFVSAGGVASPGGGGVVYIVLAFGSRSATGRKITLEGQAGACSFRGFYVGPTETVWKTDQTDEPKIAVIGDSIAAGTGAAYQWDAWPSVLGDYLGTDNMWNMGQGGTGYIQDGSSWKYISHITDWTSQTDLDLVVFSGGNNDSSLAPSAVQAAASLVLSQTRAALPNTPIVVIGPDNSSTGPSTLIINTEAAIKAAVVALADPMIVFVPTVTTGEGTPEVYGTGYPGATNGTGNADVYSGTDSTHPQEIGHLYRGKRRAARVRAALQQIGLASATSKNLTTYGTLTVDFGPTPVYAKGFTLGMSSVLPTNRVSMSYAPTSDEAEMDGLNASAWCPVAGTLQIYVQADPGPVSGQRTLNFTIN